MQERIESAADHFDYLLKLEEHVEEWKAARTALIELPMNSPEGRQALNRLSNAEDALRNCKP